MTQEDTKNYNIGRNALIFAFITACCIGLYLYFKGRNDASDKIKLEQTQQAKKATEAKIKATEQEQAVERNEVSQQSKEAVKRAENAVKELRREVPVTPPATNNEKNEYIKNFEL